MHVDMIATVNLAFMQPLDSVNAWKLIPDLIRERRNNRIKKLKFKVVK
jgi:hypothetical protein